MCYMCTLCDCFCAIILAYTVGLLMCIRLLQVPAALMNVIEEKSLKDKRNVNMFYLLFWSSLYQLLTVFAFFWTDLIPGFGYTNNIHEFGEK